ncbi:MAG: CopG family transcriptional regulator [Coriobacteriia bacterium]|nr:CopG family transcriptional regulator [Coriobacteriia bacterium]
MSIQRRSTIYLEPELHQALRLKSAVTDRSVSELVNEAVRAALAEDEEDLRAFSERADEPLVAYEDALEYLKRDGKL